MKADTREAYLRRYRRHAPPRKGRGRRELIHTLFPYSKPFNIVQLAQLCWCETLDFEPVRLNR